MINSDWHISHDTSPHTPPPSSPLHPPSFPASPFSLALRVASTTWDSSMWQSAHIPFHISHPLSSNDIPRPAGLCWVTASGDGVGVGVGRCRGEVRPSWIGKREKKKITSHNKVLHSFGAKFPVPPRPSFLLVGILEPCM